MLTNNEFRGDLSSNGVKESDKRKFSRKTTVDQEVKSHSLAELV